jgi:hypothetical protein
MDVPNVDKPNADEFGAPKDEVGAPTVDPPNVGALDNSPNAEPVAPPKAEVDAPNAEIGFETVEENIDPAASELEFCGPAPSEANPEGIAVAGAAAGAEKLET